MTRASCLWRERDGREREIFLFFFESSWWQSWASKMIACLIKGSTQGRIWPLRGHACRGERGCECVCVCGSERGRCLPENVFMSSLCARHHCKLRRHITCFQRLTLMARIVHSCSCRRLLCCQMKRWWVEAQATNVLSPCSTCSEVAALECQCYM